LPNFRTGTVVELLLERPGLQRTLVDLGDPEPARAYALTQLTGPVAVGDRVILNTTAVDLDLGTGGWHVVHWNLARETWSEPGGGHIMKLRYTSLQADTGAGEELHPDVADRIDGTPVVVCTVHSQVPCVVVACRAARPDARVVYVMTDGAALPLALSDLTAAMCDTGLLAGTVTAGHAFGGDLEAVAVPSALALARHVVGADVVVVGMGPGVVGTASPLGTTAVEVAGVVDAASAMGARVALCCRASGADPRPRHRGVSHHVRTILGLAAVRPEVPLPAALAGEVVGATVVDGPDPAAVLDGLGLTVTTMSRGPADDPPFFAAAASAGAWAAAALP
jgi:Protein of unknown function (DUF3866)